jgi:hypothetical protein
VVDGAIFGAFFSVARRRSCTRLHCQDQVHLRVAATGEVPEESIVASVVAEQWQRRSRQGRSFLPVHPARHTVGIGGDAEDNVVFLDR